MIRIANYVNVNLWIANDYGFGKHVMPALHQS